MNGLLALDTAVFFFLAIAAMVGALVSSQDENQIAIGGTGLADVVTSALMVAAVAGAAGRLVVHLSSQEGSR